jgi:adenylate kinase family enzyme
MQFIVLIGASGAGKTTVARAIGQRYAEEVDVFHFDSIGVPSVAQMTAEYGSGETTALSLDQSVDHVMSWLRATPNSSQSSQI